MKKNKGVRLILTGLVSVLPLSALAQTKADTINGINGFGDIINAVTKSIVGSLVTLFATGAMAAFFFGIVQFIFGIRDGDSGKMKNGKNFMLWGLIALFVMFSVWGIIGYVQRTIGITDNRIPIPTNAIQFQGSANSVDPLGGVNTGIFSCPPGTPNAGAAYRNQVEYNSVCLRANGGTGGGAGAGVVNTGSGGLNTTGGPVQGTGADCTVDSECTGAGLICVNYTCQLPSNNNSSNSPVGYCPDGQPYYSASDVKFCGSATCSGYNNQADCTSNGCSWSDAEGSCSQ